eukprot:scpid21972/ scgid6178/ Probable serine/threonine-protein kinase drkC; Receptor-like kinase 3; Receptor-like kinase C; Vesicle-associated receptor tyrosine kinase-like protein 3
MVLHCGQGHACRCRAVALMLTTAIVVLEVCGTADGDDVIVDTLEYQSNQEQRTAIPNPLLPVKLQAMTPSLDQLRDPQDEMEIGSPKLVPTRTMRVSFKHLAIADAEAVVVPLVVMPTDYSGNSANVSLPTILFQYYPFPDQPSLQGAPTWASSNISCASVSTPCMGPADGLGSLLRSVVSPSGRDLILFGLRQHGNGATAVYVWRDGKLHGTEIIAGEGLSSDNIVLQASALVSLPPASSSIPNGNFTVLGMYSPEVDVTEMWRLDFFNDSKSALWSGITVTSQERPARCDNIDLYYDELSQKVVLFGGEGGNLTTGGSCAFWTFDVRNANWTRGSFERDCSSARVDTVFSTFFQAESLLLVFVRESLASAVMEMSYTVYLKFLGSSSAWIALSPTLGAGMVLGADQVYILAGESAVYLVSSNSPYLYAMRKNPRLSSWAESAVDFVPVQWCDDVSAPFSWSIGSFIQPEIEFQGPFGVGFAGQSWNVLLGGAVWDSRYTPWSLSMVHRISSSLDVEHILYTTSSTVLQIPFTRHVMNGSPVGQDRGLGRGRLYVPLPDIIGDSCNMAVHGGLTVDRDGQMYHLGALSNLWCYDLCKVTFLPADFDPSLQPAPRYSHAGVALNATSFVLFGGKRPVHENSTLAIDVLSDVWLFSFANLADRAHCRGTWQNLSAAYGQPEMLPLSAPAVVNVIASGKQRILVFGGLQQAIGRLVSAEFFELSVDVASQAYTIREVRQEHYTLPGRVGHTLQQYSSDSLLLIGGKGRDDPRMSMAFLLYFYVNKQDVFCISRAVKLFAHEPMIGLSVASVTSGLVLLASSVIQKSTHRHSSKQATSIFYLPFGLCQAGYALNTSSGQCTACPRGTWGSRGTACIQCPKATTTLGPSSISSSDCTVCTRSICNWHGNCSVIDNKAICRCHWGYYERDNCFMPYYFIAGGGLLFLFAIAAGVAGYVSMKRRRSQKELSREKRASKKRLSTFMAAWKIDWEQLRLRHVVGEGAYGQVWLAELSDTLVVLKKLKQSLQRDDLCSREFQREVELMKLHRHPNIVFFLGAGTDPRNEPFLVMEYAKRGSLKALLQNSSVTISHTDRLRFMLDAAKGMEYLHGLHPPVVHRDLKCSNLLVTERWVVKVADFGTARLMSHLNESSRHRRPTDTGRTQPVNETDPLLLHQDDSPVTFNNGTDAYVSPERIRKELYHTSADVYSFGIVLCEAYMRETPYRKKNYKFSNELYKDVLEGGRPDFPKDEAPGDYTALVTACWQHDPADRLSFPEIVRSLDVQLIAW